MFSSSLQTEIPVSKAILDQNASIVKKIDAANAAVLEAIIAICNEVDDPVSMNLLGVDADFLKSVLESKAKFKSIGMTGVPLWSVRIASSDMSGLVKSNASIDSMFKSLLKTFGKDVGIRSL
jgi:hypothetical protein